MALIYFLSGFIFATIAVVFAQDKDPLMYRMNWKEELFFGFFLIAGAGLMGAAIITLGG